MGNFLKRAGWVFLAGLFVLTALGVGLVSFWESDHTSSSPTTPTASTTAPKCTYDPAIQPNVEPTKGKLAGAKLSDFTPTGSASSLSCIDIKIGSSGKTVQSGSTVTANYTGALASNGVIFQSSLDNDGQPFSSALSSLIPGWQQGLLGMRAGGERRLIVPASLAYGAQAQTGIPANSTLVFDITVLAVQ